MRISFDNEGFLVHKYFASENDPTCIISTSTNLPNNGVIQLGKIERISEEILDALPKIYFLQCTFPCTDLSAVNADAKGLHGE